MTLPAAFGTEKFIHKLLTLNQLGTLSAHRTLYLSAIFNYVGALGASADAKRNRIWRFLDQNCQDKTRAYQHNPQEAKLNAPT